MRKALAFILAFGMALAPIAAASPQPGGARFGLRAQDQQDQQDQSSYEPYTNDQLDNMLAPIALYPDPLLAQVLVAATFPDQIDAADRYVRSYGQNGVDDQDWDVTVRAVAHYPTVLDMMDNDLDWTTAVGQAYVNQSTDVMASVQRLREMALQQGNLVNTPQEQVGDENGYIYIWPESPEYIYVPTYDPSLIYYQPCYTNGVYIGFSFGAPLVIGAWLNLDFNWGSHRVYYTGWQGSGWIARSRPHVQINNIYVNNRYQNIQVNRTVLQRQVNYQGLSNYQSVHQDVNFQNRVRPGQPPAQPAPNRVPNKVIDRNIPNQSFQQFRGHAQPVQPSPARQSPPAEPRQPSPPPVYQPQPQQRYTPPARQSPTARQTPPAEPRQPSQPPVYQPRQQPQPQQRYTPPARPQQQPRSFYQPAPAQRAPSPPAPAPPNAFGRGDSPFNTNAASQRGQQSRQQMYQRPAQAPAPRPAPAARPAPASRPAPRGQSQGHAGHPGRR